MKTLNKIWSVGLTLALVLTLLAFAAPQSVEAAPGNMTWSAQSVPSATGTVLLDLSDVGDVAAANDGSTVYAIDSQSGLCNAVGFCYKSSNNGQSFTAVAGIPAGAGAVAPVAIAVASDNPEVIAVTDGILVYTSSNGGTTWSSLPVFGAIWVGGSVITDVAVGPARSGTLLGREFAVSVADPTAAATNTATMQGDVLIIGATATWATVGGAIQGTADYMAVTFSPNFVGDRCVVAVGSAVAGGCQLDIINTATNTLVRSTAFGTGLTTIDYRAAGAVTFNIASADIALPSDFDPSTSSGQRSYVVIAATATFTDNDVYRIDAGTSLDLGAGGAGTAYHSVAYAGTIDEGTLFVGETATNTIKSSTNAQVSLPTWTTVKKAPGLAGGVTTNVVVRTASDFATTSRVFAGTSGLESAFNVSNNGGVSFDAESMIDNGSATNTVVQIQDVAVSSDGTTLFMVTNDNAAGANNLHLWKSATPVSSISWSRIYVAAAAAPDTGLVRLNPNWTDTPAVYFINQIAAGNIYYSSNSGDIFAVRNGAGVACVDLAIQEGTTVYFASGTVVYKSTTSAWTWGLPVSAKCAAIIDIEVAKPDHLLVGGTGIFSYSTDAAASFTNITGNAGETYLVTPDDDYDTNNTVFLADNSAAITSGGAYRFIIGTDSVLTALTNSNVALGAVPVVGLGMGNGTLYVMTDASVAGAPAGVVVSSGCDRNMIPKAAPATVAASWDTMITGLNVAAAAAPVIVGFSVSAGANNVLYNHDGAVTLRAYDDVFSTASVALGSPGDGATVSIDPVNGRADPVTLTWGAVGVGAGAGNRVDMQIITSGDDWGSATTNANQALANPSSPQVTMGPLETWAYNMRANTAYQWRVRFDRAVSGEVIRTGWSTPYTLKVQGGTVVQQPHAGPVILGPAGGSTTSTTPGIAWAPYAAATKYQIILATDPELKNRVAGTPVFVTAPAWQPTEALAEGTTYFFGITAVEPTVSPQSVGTFITSVKPAPAPEPTPAVIVKEQAPMPAPIINIPPAQQVAPAYIWAIVIIGAILVIAVIVLIVRTRRPM